MHSSHYFNRENNFSQESIASSLKKTRIKRTSSTKGKLIQKLDEVIEQYNKFNEELKEVLINVVEV